VTGETDGWCVYVAVSVTTGQVTSRQREPGSSALVPDARVLPGPLVETYGKKRRVILACVRRTDVLCACTVKSQRDSVAFHCFTACNRWGKLLDPANEDKIVLRVSRRRAVCLRQLTEPRRVFLFN